MLRGKSLYLASDYLLQNTLKHYKSSNSLVYSCFYQRPSFIKYLNGMNSLTLKSFSSVNDNNSNNENKEKKHDIQKKDNEKNKKDVLMKEENKEVEGNNEESKLSENKKKKKSRKNSKSKIASTSTKTNPINDSKSIPEENINSKTRTLPLKASKIELNAKESKLPQKLYVLLNSKFPILPYTQQNGLIRTGNLKTSDITNEFAYFLQTDEGEIYTVGVILKSDVNKEVKRVMETKLKEKPKSSLYDEGSITINDDSIKAMISTKENNYRVKLVEIEHKDNCIFAKAIPYKDRSLTKQEKLVSIPNEIMAIKRSINAIMLSMKEERNDFFRRISLDRFLEVDSAYEISELDHELYKIVDEILKFQNTKQNTNAFIQWFMEQRTIVSRILVLKRKLEDIDTSLQIVNQTLKEADAVSWKLTEKFTAKLAVEYIKTQYFYPGFSNYFNAASNQTLGGQPLSSAAKKFMEKLPLIKDNVSKEKIKKEIEKFGILDRQSSEYQKLYTYLDEVFSIPWNTYTEEVWDTDYSKDTLNELAYGLEKVKQRILELIAINQLKRAKEGSSKKGFIILLYGPPGTGKTSVAKAVAKALKRESRFISFAGVTDPHFIKGHRRTYVDSQPGVFIKELIKAKTLNPVFIVDEIDKLSRNRVGVDPYYSLLEILNSEENHHFTDHYLDIPVDFSQVIFILTANQVLQMLEPLRNRFEIIEIPPYIEEEKIAIAKKYLLPRILKENGLDKDNIYIDDQTLKNIIKGWCYSESGVRELKRCLEKICRKHAKDIIAQWDVESTNNTININEGDLVSKENELIDNNEGNMSNNIKSENIIIENNDDGEDGIKIINAINVEKSENKNKNELMKQEIKCLIEIKNKLKLIFDSKNDPSGESLMPYLGRPQWDMVTERRHRKQASGIVNVLTVSGFTGHVLSVECAYDLSQPDKRGHFTSSGNLQKVLQESLTVAKINANCLLSTELKIDPADKNIHIHFLEGSVPKDGPSAGISICTAYLSLILNKPVPQDIAMTGELSLNGEVCKIGGLQAKITAAKALDIKTLIIPYGNKNNFYELPDKLKQDLTVYFAKDYREVFELIFGNNPNSKIIQNIESWKDGKYNEPGNMQVIQS